MTERKPDHEHARTTAACAITYEGADEHYMNLAVSYEDLDAYNERLREALAAYVAVDERDFVITGRLPELMAKGGALLAPKPAGESSDLSSAIGLLKGHVLYAGRYTDPDVLHDATVSFLDNLEGPTKEEADD